MFILLSPRFYASCIISHFFHSFSKLLEHFEAIFLDFMQIWIVCIIMSKFGAILHNLKLS